MNPHQQGLWSLAVREYMGQPFSRAHFQAGCEGSFCLLGLTVWKLDVIKKN